MKKRYCFLSLIILLFSACSKDDESDGGSVPEPVQSKQGVFIDSPVSGLKYETETHSGFTDEEGKYDYEEGETVTFYVGEIMLGSAEATGELSPISIASTSNATIETLEAQNIAAFLQTLDEDGNPENGIVLDQEVVEAISFSEIDFTKNIIQILGEIALEVFQDTGKSLKAVFPETAAVHLAETLGVEFEPQDKFTLNFLTTFTNYHSQSSKAIQWVHEFDEQGRLVKSTKYEKYPLKVMEIYTFHNYDENNLTVNYEVNNYYKYRLSYNENYVFQKRESLELKEWNSVRFITFIEINENHQVVKSNSLDRDGNIVSRFEKIFNSQGLNVLSKKYDINNILVSSTESKYTDFGDVSIHTNFDENNEVTSTWEYFYRSDNTLKNTEINIYHDSYTVVNFTEFNEEEVVSKEIFLYGSTKSIQFFDDGIMKYEEFYQENILTEILYYKYEYTDETHFSYRIIKKEVYDSTGNLTETICYNNGVEIECSDN